jgi:hypothetical protein
MQCLYDCNELIGVVLLKFVCVYHDTGRTRILRCRRHRYSTSIAPEYLDIVDDLNVSNIIKTFN